MKKLTVVLLLAALLAMMVGAQAESTHAAITGSDGVEASMPIGPKKVAIYDYAVLDMLNTVGFEKSGIKMLVVPSKDTLPAALDFYKQQGNDTVVSGGTLFYVDWDVLDLVQPEAIITGARSFATNAAGESLSTEDRAKYVSDTQERYPGVGIVRLSVNASDSQLLPDMRGNVAALSEIFPAIAEDLQAELSEIEAGMAAIHDKAQASGKTALLCMMVDQTTLSVFNPNSRFDMVYEEFGFTPVDAEAIKWEDSHGFDVRAEYVLEKNPDVIFLLDRSATVGTGAGAENFMSDPIIAQTAAAQNGNIYVLDGAAWYTITGGFTAARTMISDIGQYTDTLE